MLRWINIGGTWVRMGNRLQLSALIVYWPLQCLCTFCLSELNWEVTQIYIHSNLHPSYLLSFPNWSVVCTYWEKEDNDVIQLIGKIHLGLRSEEGHYLTINLMISLIILFLQRYVLSFLFWLMYLPLSSSVLPGCLLDNSSNTTSVWEGVPVWDPCGFHSCSNRCVGSFRANKNKAKTCMVHMQSFWEPERYFMAHCSYLTE